MPTGEHMRLRYEQAVENGSRVYAEPFRDWLAGQVEVEREKLTDLAVRRVEQRSELTMVYSGEVARGIWHGGLNQVGPLSALAKRWRVDEGWLYDILRGRIGTLDVGVVDRILIAEGMLLVDLYQPEL